MPNPISPGASLLVAIALLGAGCCLSITGQGTGAATGAGQSGGQGTSGQGTSGQGTSGQASGGGASNGGLATGGGCEGVGPILLVVPSTLDFGPTRINTSAHGSVTLLNCSTAPVTQITATVYGPDANLFTVENAPVTLGAGDSATVNLNYSPLPLETRSMAMVEFEGSDGEVAPLSLFGEPTGLALTVQPSLCDFGYVGLDTTGVCCSVVSNQSNVLITITGVSGFDTDDGAFGVATTDNSTPPNPQTFPATPISLQGGDSANVCFSFTPPDSQQFSGQVTLVTDATVNPTIQLSGWGGGPRISCTPLSVDFGPRLDHDVTTVPIICTNVGTAIPDTNLIIEPPTASPAVFSAQFDQTSDVYPLNGLAPGDSAQIDVSYAPVTSSSDMGTLFIKNNGGQGVTLQIPLSGQGLNASPCQFQIAPVSLNFGNAQIGDSTSLAFDVTNVGNDICQVTGPRIWDDEAGAFRIVSTNIAPDPVTGQITVPVSSRFTVTVEFSPSSTGAFSAEILFAISDPTDPNQDVLLSGTSADTCLEVTPTSLDFGQLGTADGGAIFNSQTKSFTVSDQCQTAATIQGISIQNGPGDLGSQYSEPNGPPLPDSLPAGGQATYQLLCQPTSTGEHPAEILISDGTVEVLLPMTCDVD